MVAREECEVREEDGASAERAPEGEHREAHHGRLEETEGAELEDERDVEVEREREPRREEREPLQTVAELADRDGRETCTVRNAVERRGQVVAEFERVVAGGPRRRCGNRPQAGIAEGEGRIWRT